MANTETVQAAASTGTASTGTASTGAASLDPAWLRDNCPCPACRDPVSGQRLISITDQAPGGTVTSIVESPGGACVTFGPDGHQAVFTRTWLSQETAAAVDPRTEDAKRLWSAADFTAGAPATPGRITRPASRSGWTACAACCPMGSCCCAASR